MSKKTWILIACLVLSLTMGLGGSLAFLTDRDADVNVFTMGNVDIELTEKFEQGTPLTPGVKIEKDVKVANIGPNTAWVWVDIAIPSELDEPSDASANGVHFNYAKESVVEGLWNWWTDEAKKNWNVKEDVAIDNSGIKYNIYTVLYETPLAAGETTEASAMFQVYMDAHIDIAPDGQVYHVENGVATKIDWNVKVQGAPLMHVAAYAIQKDGFDKVQDAYAAYNTQWGENGLVWGEVVNGKDQYNDAGKADDGTVRYEGYPVKDGEVIDGLTVIDTTGEGESLRALYNDGNTSPRVTKDLVIKNSYLDGTYAMNVYGTVGGTAKLIVEDTTLAGWTSYTNFVSAEFTNCKFMINSKGTQNHLRAYCPTTLTNCELAGTTLDVDGTGAYTLVDCTFNGELITAASQLIGTDDSCITIANK